MIIFNPIPFSFKKLVVILYIIMSEFSVKCR